MRRLLRILAVGLAVVLAAVAFPAAANADPPVGPWIKFVNFHDNTCLDLSGGSGARGTALTVSTCNPNRGSQVWAIYQNNGRFIIKSAAAAVLGNNECVSVANKSLLNQAWIVLWDCKADNDNQDQRWSWASVRAGCFGIQNANSDLFMGTRNSFPYYQVVQETGPAFDDKVWCDVLSGTL